MRKRAALIATLIAPVLIVVSSNSSEAEDESKFFLQDDGEIRVLRGIESDTNFEPATLPEEVDVTPAAAPAAQVEPTQPRTEVGPKTTREAALQRARERGITVHQAGVLEERGPESGRTRREAVERARERGIPTHRAGDAGYTKD
jgi:pyruvate/2-oxoglutarate dehydrogenase complex dihydrolipoamide acyltransferase (E2) component